MLLKERRTLLGQNWIPATYKKKIDTVIHAASPLPSHAERQLPVGTAMSGPLTTDLLFRTQEQAHRADKDYRGGQLWLQVSVECTVSRKSNRKSFIFRETLIVNLKLMESWTECIKWSQNFRCHSVCLLHIRFINKIILFGKIIVFMLILAVAKGKKIWHCFILIIKSRQCICFGRQQFSPVFKQWTQWWAVLELFSKDQVFFQRLNFLILIFYRLQMLSCKRVYRMINKRFKKFFFGNSVIL